MILRIRSIPFSVKVLLDGLAQHELDNLRVNQMLHMGFDLLMDERSSRSH